MKKEYLWLMIFLIITTAATALVSVYIYSENTRYYIQTASSPGKGIIVAYKIDRKTGQTWQIINGKEKVIKNLSDVKSQQNIFETQDLQQRTIEMVKKYSDGLGSMASRIRKLMEETKGNLKIFGWKSYKIDDQTYLVSYTFDEGSGEVGYFFEVNLVGEIIRSVNKDHILSVKYKLKSSAK